MVHLGRFSFQAALTQSASPTQHLPPHVPPCWVLVGVLVALPVTLVSVEDPPAERCRRPVGSTAGTNSLLELVCSPLLEQRGQLIVRGVNPRLLQQSERFLAFHRPAPVGIRWSHRSASAAERARPGSSLCGGCCLAAPHASQPQATDRPPPLQRRGRLLALSVCFSVSLSVCL